MITPPVASPLRARLEASAPRIAQEHVDGFAANRGLSGERDLGDGRVTITVSEALCEPSRLGITLAQKRVRVRDAIAGQDALVAHVAEPLPQTTEQFDFLIGLGRKVGVAALEGDRVIALAVPEQQRLAEPGTRSDDRKRGLRRSDVACADHSYSRHGPVPHRT